MSPMSGNVIGSREIHVTSDKVDVTGLSVQVISGLTLNILPDVDLESCYHAHVDISEMLHSKYQVPFSLVIPTTVEPFRHHR